MNIQEKKNPYSYKNLVSDSASYIKELLQQFLPETKIYLFGSRARKDSGRASDFDIWIDSEVKPEVLAAIQDQLEESFVPFPANFVLPSDLKGEFGKQVKRDAIQWN